MEKYHSTKEISERYNIPLSSLSRKCRKMGIKLINNKYQLTKSEIDFMVHNFDSKKIPDIIYVTRTWEIYPSKINYLTLKQL